MDPKPILKEIKHDQVTEESKDKEPKASKNFPLVVKLNPYKEGNEAKMEEAKELAKVEKKVRF